MAAVEEEYVLHLSRARWSQRDSESGRDEWRRRRRRNMEWRRAPRSVCREVCKVQCHHFASADLGWWSGRSGRSRTCSGLPGLGRWPWPGGSDGLDRRIDNKCWKQTFNQQCQTAGTIIKDYSDLELQEYIITNHIKLSDSSSG